MVARAPADREVTMRSFEGAAAAPWPELVRTVHRQMRSLLGGGHRELEDLTQAALERVVVGLPRFEGRAEVSTFTYRVCVNVAMNHWRGWRRWLRRFRFETQEDALPDVPAEGDPRSATLEAERARRLHACLDRLSAAKRVCVTLAELEGLPASRIAAILECPEATVRSRLRAGREELSAMLRRDPFFAEEEGDARE